MFGLPEGQRGAKGRNGGETYWETGWPPLHAVFLAALIGSHGLVGWRGGGLRAEGILGKFLGLKKRERGGENRRDLLKTFRLNIQLQHENIAESSMSGEI